MCVHVYFVVFFFTRLFFVHVLYTQEYCSEALWYVHKDGVIWDGCLWVQVMGLCHSEGWIVGLLMTRVWIFSNPIWCSLVSWVYRHANWLYVLILSFKTSEACVHTLVSVALGVFLVLICLALPSERKVNNQHPGRKLALLKTRDKIK